MGQSRLVHAPVLTFVTNAIVEHQKTSTVLSPDNRLCDITGAKYGYTRKHSERIGSVLATFSSKRFLIERRDGARLSGSGSTCPDDDLFNVLVGNG